MLRFACLLLAASGVMALPMSERCGLIRADARAALSAGRAAISGGQETMSRGQEKRFFGLGTLGGITSTCDGDGDGVVGDVEMVSCVERILFNPFAIQLLLPFLWAGCTTTTTDTDDTDADGDADGDGVRMDWRTLRSFHAAVRRNSKGA